MSRVWKKFFGKVWYVVKTMLIIGALWAFTSFLFGAFMHFILKIEDLAMIVFAALALPMIILFFGFIIRETWKDSRDEVERENRRLMRDLGDTR